MRSCVRFVAILLVLLPIACGEEPTQPKDTIAPAAVTDLVAGSPTDTTLTLTWTAPGDDGRSGRASRYDIRYAGTALTSTSWATATRVATTPVPGPAGAHEVLVVRLTGGSQFYFALETADEVPNWSALSNVATSATLDAIAPAAIVDLVAVAASESSLTLAWTAPGDDGRTGRATRYDIRYSASPITPARWDSTSHVLDPPVPRAPGAREAVVVHPLSSAKVYYVAIETGDEVPNWSALSNVASFSTLARIAPSAVHDLRVTATSDSTVRVAWTAPGDDGNVGTATRYEIRYAATSLSDANWDSAAEASSPPTPLPAGSTQECLVHLLEEPVALYFALRSWGTAGNASEISNVVLVDGVRGEKNLIETLRRAYESRAYTKFQSLLADFSSERVEFLFTGPSGTGDQWGVTDERRLQRRMFQPQNTDPGDPPVPADLWLNSIVCGLVAEAGFAERPDLYRGPTNPDGIDPARWRITDALYFHEVFFDEVGSLDFYVTGNTNFVVANDLGKAPGSPGKFFILHWEDTGTSDPHAVGATWTSVKKLYR